MTRDFAAVYERLRPWLPPHASDILDIGCGHAEIDVFLARHYLDLNGHINVHLLDGDSSHIVHAHKRVAYAQNPQPWRSRFLGVDNLKLHVPACAVFDYPAVPTLTIPCDLLISIRSWGHHYPIAVYSDLADRSVRPAGRIITDLRLEADVDGAVATLKKRGFRVISDDVELHSKKCMRLVFER